MTTWQEAKATLVDAMMREFEAEGTAGESEAQRAVFAAEAALRSCCDSEEQFADLHGRAFVEALRRLDEAGR